MRINKLGHYSIRTTDLEASRKFYTQILGFREGFRPPFDFPGIWLYLEDDEADYGVVHIIGIDHDNPQGLRDYLGEKNESLLVGTGVVDHVAFLAEGLAAMRSRLDHAGLDRSERTVPALGLHQVFITDPSGVTVELNFPGAEALAPSLT